MMQWCGKGSEEMEVLLCFLKVLGFADVDPEVCVVAEGLNVVPLSSEVEINICHGEDACAGYEGDEFHPEGVDAAEGKGDEVSCEGAHQSFFPFISVAPAAEAEVLVPEEDPGGLPLAGSQGGQGSAADVLLHEGSEIQIGEDIGIDDEDVFCIAEQRCCLHQSTPGLEEEFAFVADVDVHAPFAAVEESPHAAGKVVDVHHHLFAACGPEPLQVYLEEGLAAQLDQGLGPVEGEGVQAGAEAGCEKHGFHGVKIGGSENRDVREQILDIRI